MLETLRPPTPRPLWRRRLGKQYYRFRRWLQWQWGGQHFARPAENLLATTIFQHQTPLLRRLKDVDMQLQYNKVTNLRLAAACIDGVLLRPGEVFSFWHLVGRPSASKGYLPGLVLESGKATTGIGGGLCQMGNLIYWMALHAPLTVTERWRHSYDVFPDADRRLPFGSGATLAYNYIDLQIKNETDRAFQLHIWLTETDLHGAILAAEPADTRYEVFEQEHLMRAEIWGGYSRHNRIGRRIYDMASGTLLREEIVTENHALMMYQPFLEAKNFSFTAPQT